LIRPGDEKYSSSFPPKPRPDERWVSSTVPFPAAGGRPDASTAMADTIPSRRATTLKSTPADPMLKSILAPLLALLLLPSAAQAQSRKAIAGIAKQFDRHDLIMIGELHRSREIHAFLQKMLRDPGFICRADDDVVEFGNSRLQALADAYVSGGLVSDVQIQDAWRETAVPLTWNSPLYGQVYETVRDINARRLCPHPVRLVLADPPLDWSLINGPRDLEPFADRDGSYAAVVEREVIAKHHRALLIAGELHALKKIPNDMHDDPDELDAAQLIERAHPGILFSVATVPLPNAAKALALSAAPSFRVVHGSPLEQADFQLTDWQSTVTRTSVDGKPAWKVEPPKHWPRMGEAVDGLLYVGGNTSVYPSPTIYLDRAYQHELRRRATIIKEWNGQDFITGIDALVREASKTGH
jgi:hypothetical protein